MHIVVWWWIGFVMAGCFCQASISFGKSKDQSDKSESRRLRRNSNNNNCKPGRRARSYADTARMWERDLTELRLYLDEKLSNLDYTMGLLRSQIADVGNDISRLTGQGSDSNQTPLQLRLERLESNLASLLIRLQQHVTCPQTPVSRALVKDHKTDLSPESELIPPDAKTTPEVRHTSPKPSSENVMPAITTPKPSFEYVMPAITTPAITDKPPQTKPINAREGLPCFWYNLPPSKASPVYTRQLNHDHEESKGLEVCSQSDPGPPPKAPMEDCSDGSTPRPAGVYWIKPIGLQKPIMVFCDSDGWTVIQRRGLSPPTSPENFNRSWTSYARGFGDLCADFWLGNTHLHHLTTLHSTALRIQMNDQWDSPVFRANYNKFRVGNEHQGFPLNVAEFSGSAKDGLGFQSGMPFATKDRAWSPIALACAELEGSGWWISETAYSQVIQCNHHLMGSNLNAQYTRFTTLQEDYVKFCPTNSSIKQYQHIKYANAIYWRGKYVARTKGFYSIEMKMRPKMLHREWRP